MDEKWLTLCICILALTLMIGAALLADSMRYHQQTRTTSALQGLSRTSSPVDLPVQQLEQVS